MSTPPSPDRGIRIGNDERDFAIAALGEHLSAGRLDPDEYGDRVASATVARTFADLEPLFIDLPDPRPRPPSAGPAATPSRPGPVAPTRRNDSRSAPLGGRLGETLVGLSPFIALALFFASPWHTWLIFLLVPIAGVIVYGQARGHRHRRRW
jgi:Domain of unknown function (DUF1707)